MANKPGRLYRVLADLPKPLFFVSSENTGVLTDDQIQSIVIHRGKSGSEGGASPSTLEVKTATNIVAKSGQTIEARMHSSAALALGAKLSNDPNVPAYIAPRFLGRVGKQEMEDQGKRQHITYYGASWAAQLGDAPQEYTFASGTSVQSLLSSILAPPYLGAKIPVTFHGSYDHTYGAVTGTYSDLIPKFATDVGLLLRERRAGGLDVLPLQYRKSDALSRLATAVPLTRSQALSPATWTQPNENEPPEYRLTYRTNENILKTIVTSETGEVTGTAPVQDVDWTYFRDYSGQWEYIHAMRATGFNDRFHIEKIDIDLLMLLASDKPYHLSQALDLIRMQVGDPIYLSGDWNSPLRGIHFAEAITEEISADSWNLTLSLVQFREIVGEESPAVPAKVWESSPLRWDEETRKWN